MTETDTPEQMPAHATAHNEDKGVILSVVASEESNRARVLGSPLSQPELPGLELNTTRDSDSSGVAYPRHLTTPINPPCDGPQD